MKKVYLILSALFVGGTASAQIAVNKAPEKIALPTEMPRVSTVAADRAAGDPIYMDDFSNASLWSVAADANGNAWQMIAAPGTTPTNVSDYMGDMASTTYANGFACRDGITGLLTTSVTPADCAVTLVTAFSCAGISNVTMEFEQRYRAFNSDKTIVEVSGNDGVSWTSWEINTEEPTNGPAQQELVRINITTPAAGAANVKIRFRWEELGGDPSYGSGYGWMVDDLNVFESWNYDVAAVEVFARSGVGGVAMTNGIGYGTFSTVQATAVEFSGIVDNLGAQIQTGTKLNVDVTGAGSYSGTSATTDIAVGGSDSLATTTDLTPAAVGTYDIAWYFDQTNGEEVTDNDTMYWSFEVTDNEYGVDDGLLSGGISAVSSSPDGILTIGNIMEIFANDQIGAIEIGLTSASNNVDQLIYGEAWKWDDGLGEWVFLDVTADHTITADENGGLVILPFSSPIAVAAGDAILITAGHYGGSVKPQFAMAQAVEEGVVNGFIDGSGFYLSSPNAIVVRYNNIDYTGVSEEESTFAVGQNVPNPFDNNSAISYSLNEAANVSLTIVDINGKVVMSENYGNQTAGDYKVTLDGSDFAEGTYMYTFTIGEKQVTKRMVVTK